MPYASRPDPNHPLAPDGPDPPVRTAIHTPDGIAYIDPAEIVYVSPVTTAIPPGNPEGRLRVRVCFFRGGGMFNVMESPDNRRILGIPDA